MGYENFQSIDTLSSVQMEKDHLIDSLHEKFEKQKTLYRPNPESFKGVKDFKDEEIDQEIATVSSLKEKWAHSNSAYESKNKKISDVFEGIVVDQFCGEWMAGKAEAFFTSEADDFIRKVDCVVEFRPEDEKDQNEYLGLGIDVTFSADYSTVQQKLNAIWERDVQKGKEVRVKFVETDKYKGSLDVCRVVLVANKETVFDLARLYKKKDKTELDNHPFLANIISQIKCQLESYYLYAQNKKLSPTYLRHVTKTLSTFYGIYDAKKELIESNQDVIEKSDLYKTIESFCKEKLGS